MTHNDDEGMATAAQQGGSDLDLDAIVHLDEEWYKEGYAAGQKDGHLRGYAEGKEVGYVLTGWMYMHA